MTTTLDIARLREMAEAATPGPWESNVLGSEGYEVRGPDVPHKPTSSVMRRPRVARCGYEGWDIDKANAEHIATFDPPTVLALLDRLDAAEAALGRVRALADSFDKQADELASVDEWGDTVAATVTADSWRAYSRAIRAALASTQREER